MMTQQNMFWSQFVSLSAIILFAFVSGCSNNWMPNSILYVTQAHYEPHMTLEQCTNVVTFNELGKCLFALPCGYVAAKFGRKKILICIILVNFTSWVMLSTFSSMIMIALARFLAGSSEGMFSVVGCLTVAELSSPEYRSVFSCLILASFNLGLLFEAFLSAAFGSYQLLNFSNAAISFCLIPTLFWFLESPHFLVHVRDAQKAENVLRKLRPTRSESAIREEFEDIRKFVEGKGGDAGNGRLWRLVLERKCVREAMLCGILVTVLTPLTGNVQIRLFMSVALPANEYVPNSSYPLVSHVVGFGGSTLSLLVVKRFRRRLLLVAAYAGVCLTQSVNCVCCFLYENGGHVLWRWAFLGGNLWVVALSAAILVPTSDTVRSEILPYAVKEVATAVCLILRSPALVVSYKLFVYAQQTVGLHVAYATFAVVAAASSVATYALLPETAGKSLADVQNAFENNDEPEKVEKY